MTNPQRIILLAHGSSDKRWCETFEQLAAPTLNSVEHSAIAYMELATPSLESVISAGKADGISHFTIIPLFLAAGRHLRKDVPAMIAELEEHHGVTIHLARPIGQSERLAAAVRDVVIEELEAQP